MDKTTRILLVDDREENHISLEAIFQHSNYDFVHAYSGEEALKILLKETDFTLIILDVMMPGMDGFETAAYIAERKKVKNIPIIFLTAKDYENQIFKAFNLGAVDYISKPVIPEVLKDKVKVFVDLSLKNLALEEQKEELKRINKELKDEIRERKASQRKVNRLNKELNSKLSELEALDAFSYSVAHDFRSPLNNLSMIAHLLKMKLKDDEQVMDYMTKVDRQVARLNNLIEDLLLFSHHDMVIQKEDVEMQPLVEDLVEELKFTYKASPNGQIKVNQLPDAHCNPGLVKQVWTNLISNAIKYSMHEPEPVIEIGSEEKEGQLYYYVRDNGMGFSKQEGKNLFQIYKRLKGAKNIQGSGVGLALVQRIVKKHGGKIFAESKKGVKTTFYFSLGYLKH